MRLPDFFGGPRGGLADNLDEARKRQLLHAIRVEIGALGALFVSGMIIAVDSGSSKPLIFASVAGVLAVLLLAVPRCAPLLRNGQVGWRSQSWLAILHRPEPSYSYRLWDGSCSRNSGR